MKRTIWIGIRISLEPDVPDGAMPVRCDRPIHAFWALCTSVEDVYTWDGMNYFGYPYQMDPADYPDFDEAQKLNGSDT